MAEKMEQFSYDISEQIRTHAMSFPETTEGSSCVNRAFKAGTKNFVFLGEKDDECTIRLKLDASVDEVAGLSGDAPDRFEVGKGGWTKLTFPPDDPPALKDLERWITESFFLLAPKKISKQLS